MGVLDGGAWIRVLKQQSVINIADNWFHSRK
jgi:hypothetical protein